ncbi:homeobox-leucine zipper protein HOX11-like isoform X2 [Prosopis cineraria]|uniref:homeobox-leucine zipper protein HOX11-like isoform X2 n=1 Tax=Prosopis cineraria TaxID=364024 RepID=UPI00240FA391|nr:homeobox-leucine zipper protein HOX11-like isoform X2 [Prosopis cineraria]
MELALSLGDAPKPFSFLDKVTDKHGQEPGFCIPLVAGFAAKRWNHRDSDEDSRSSSGPPVQLDLLSLTPLPPPPSRLSIPWLSRPCGEEISLDRAVASRGLDVNSAPSDVDEADDAAALSSPNSGISSFHMDFRVRNGDGTGGYKREHESNADRPSDDDENGSSRKKLRLSKEQSAFLEESFKEHATLNPKQKLSLAKQLNLRPRQVEVWFQNRRARTKLKQTEVDCEYLKRCCETLTEENRRLQKEVQELRALKTSQPYYMQLPATTLTMCPSCERVVTKSSAAGTTSTATATATCTGGASGIPISLSLGRPGMLPFANGQA